MKSIKIEGKPKEEDKQLEGELKVNDLKEIIHSQYGNIKTFSLEEYNHLSGELKELQLENKHLQNIVEMYRDKRDRFCRFRNRTLFCIISGLLLFQGAKFIKKQEEDKITQQIIAVEKQLDEEIKNFSLTEILGKDVKEPENIKLGTVLEDYIGIDLDDTKVALLDGLHDVSFVKYQLDSGEKKSFCDMMCLDSISGQIKMIIYMDNPELENYIINIQDEYLYANGEYKMSDELFISYSLGIDASDSMWREKEFEVSADELDFAIDTCLKATCYDVLLDYEEEKLDFSLSRVAKEYDYQLPSVMESKRNYCESPKVKMKSSNPPLDKKK